MNKKGFTLVELLAVVTIISLILLLSLPRIIQQINNSKFEVNDTTKKIIFNAAEKYLKDFRQTEESDGNTYCVSINELLDEDYLSDEASSNNINFDFKKSKPSVKINYNEDNGYTYELVEYGNCLENNYMVNEGLIPVTYKNNKWIISSIINKNKEWYDYDNQHWANVVTLLPGVKKNVGEEVKVDGTEANMMFVWIPRYEYKIEGTYGTHTDGTVGTTDLPGEIKIKFIDSDKIVADNGYIIHPAFEFGNDASDKKHLDGIWVGKFQLSTFNQKNYNCIDDHCKGASEITTLPNKKSLHSNNLSSYFYLIKSLENSNEFKIDNVDTHMIKNIEWGAVAYLSQSKYGKYGNNDYTGKYKEIYHNNSLGISGKSSGDIAYEDKINIGNCNYDDMKKLGIDNENNKRGQCGPGASTTGNIYGAYDMVGSFWEYVAAFIEDTNNKKYAANSGFNGLIYSNNNTIEKTDGIDLPELKYYDVYSTSVAQNYSTDNKYHKFAGIDGDATIETYRWYNDTHVLSQYYQEQPFVLRGGKFGYESTSSDAGTYNKVYNSDGIFKIYYLDGGQNGEVSTRIILTLS